MIGAFGIAAASLMAGLSAWRSLKEAETRATEAWERGTEAIQSEARVRTAMGEVLLDLARGLRHAEVGDPQALSETFGRIGRQIRETAADPAVDITDVERADTLLREMAETLLQVGELEEAQRLAASAVDVAEARVVAAPSPEATTAYALATSLVGRLAVAADDRDAARRNLEKARTLMAELLRKRENDHAAQAALAQTLLPLSRILQGEGEEDEALAMATEAAGLWNDAVTASDVSPQWQRARAETLEQLVQWRREQGGTAAVGEVAAQAVAARRAVLEARPQSDDARAALAEALLVQGQAQLAAGRAEEAREALWEGYSLQRGLEEADAEAFRTLMETLESLAIAGAQSGDAAIAVQLLQDAAHLRRQSLERQPDDEEAMLRLAQTLTRLGDARAETGILGAALDAYEESLRLLQRLGAEESDDPVLKAARADAWEAIGELRLGEGEAQGALGYFREVADIRRELAKAAADDTARKEALATTLENLGDGYRAAGEPAQAAASYAEAIDLRRGFLAAEPENKARLRDLAHLLMRQGEMELKRERLDAARPVVLEVAKIAERMTDEGTGSADLLREVAGSVEQLGDLALAEGDAEQAADRYRRALELRQDLAEGDPARAEAPVALALGHARIGDALRSSGKEDEAAEAYIHCADLLRQIVSGEEQNARAARQLALCLYKLAVVSDGDRRQSAQEEAEQVIEPLKAAGLLPAETATEIEELRSSLSAS